MDVLEEYGGLVNGEPLRIRPEDMKRLAEVASMLSTMPYVSRINNNTDVLEISRAVNQLVDDHNRIAGIQIELMILLNKIVSYNK